MSRLQVMPLPTQKAGDFEHTPFVLVIDQAADDEWSEAAVRHIKVHTRADLVIVHEGTIDVSEPLELTAEQGENLRRYLTEPIRVEVKPTPHTEQADLKVAIDQAAEDIDMAVKHFAVRQSFTPDN